MLYLSTLRKHFGIIMESSCAFLSRDSVLRNVTKGKRKDMTSIIKHLGYYPIQYLQISTSPLEDRAHQRKSYQNWLVGQYLKETGLIYEQINKSQRAAESRNQAPEILITILHQHRQCPSVWIELLENVLYLLQWSKTNIELIESSKFLLFIIYIGWLRYNC